MGPALRIAVSLDELWARADAGTVTPEDYRRLLVELERLRGELATANEQLHYRTQLLRLVRDALGEQFQALHALAD